ncbi:hypothetical protein L1049_023468 [Liquidambar formosana]|uniref:Uncharacterized protein n=1 Tax=Liquidambar formosana TaxID=63359 RepID=A0AAP0RZ64_LIQFO
MAKIQLIYTCVFLLALILCHGILFTEGRQMKSMTPNQSLGFGNSDVALEDDFRPTTPGNSPGVGFVESNKDDEPADAIGNNRPVGKYYKEDDTSTPGHSPGVGHGFMESNEDDEPAEAIGNDSPVGKYYKEDGVSTPGHSPGVGHPLQNKNAEPKA